MKLNLLVLLVTVLGSAAFASEKKFVCESPSPLWNSVVGVQFSYDSVSQQMNLSFEMDSEVIKMSGTIDKKYHSRMPNMFRFVDAKGNYDYSELTSESYVCEILADQKLLSANSTGGKLVLRCRGESFENGYYTCK